MSEPAPSAEIGVQATPLHELERLLASRPQPSTARSTVSAATPRVELLLRPAPSPTAASGVVMPSSKDAASAAPVLSSSSTATASATAGGASDSSSLSRVCAACQRQYAKYVCPKCNLNTCSLPCYKSHNESCTHGFAATALAEERVIDTALRQGLGRTRAVLGEEFKAARQARKATTEIMQRVADFNQNDAARMETIMSAPMAAAKQEDDDDDAKDGDDDEQQNEERLMAALMLIERMDSKSAASSSASAAISNAELLELQSLLPPAMLKDFQRSIVDGRMSAWLARWKPWWRSDLQLHTEGGDADSATRAPPKEQDLTPLLWSLPSVQISVVADESDDAPPNAPPMPDGVPAFSSLFPGSPSPLLPVHLIELLYAYAYSLMLYNGDPDAEVEGIVGVMAQLSPVLTGTATPAQSAGTAAASSASIAGASSAAAVGHPSSPPSFVPTPSLLSSLDASVTALLSTASSSPSLSSSCCWAVARLGDVCQLQCSKTNVMRALSHMQSMIERAKAISKKTKSKEKSTAAKSAPSAGGPVPASPVASLSYAPMIRKLVFFQSFVSGVLSDAQLREWNRVLYSVWQQRWQMHTDMHANKSAAPGQPTTTPAASKQKATIQIIE